MNDRGRTVDVVQGYELWAHEYDSCTNRTRDLAVRFVRDAIEGTAFEYAVEFGCGTGLVTELLAPRANRITAFDVSSAMLDQARSRVSMPHVFFTNHDATAVPWPMKPPVDLVVGTLVLEHVADPAPVIREASRLLAPGGSLLLCEFHPHRQLAGRQARFIDRSTGEPIQVKAYAHRISDFVTAGLEAGLRLTVLEEPRHPDDDDPWPRLLAIVFERPDTGTTPFHGLY